MKMVIDDFMMVDVGLITPMDTNPRKDFDEDGLIELTESIKEHGIIQPLVVRGSVDGFDLVAGERRLRSARRAGLDVVPCILKELTDLEVAEIQLIENIDRHQLSPLEESAGVCRLVELGCAPRDVAGKLARSDEWVQLRLDLPTLPETAREALSEGRIGLGGARQLLRVEPVQRDEAAQRLMELDGELSERAVADLLRSRYHEPRRRREAWKKLLPDLVRKYGERSAAVSDVETSYQYVRAWGVGIGHWVTTDDEVGGLARHPAESVITWGELVDQHEVETLLVCAGAEVEIESVIEVVDKRLIVDAERALREQGKVHTLGPRKQVLDESDDDEPGDEPGDVGDPGDVGGEDYQSFEQLVARHVLAALELRPEDDELRELLVPVLEMCGARG